MAYSDNIRDLLGRSESTVERNSDMGNAQRFVRRFRYELLHCEEQGWLVWDGKRFREGNGAAVEYAKVLVHEMFEQATTKGNIEWARTSQSKHSIYAMLDLAKTDRHFAISMDELDRQISLLNVRNGELNLEHMELHQHNQASAFTKLVDIDYSLHAPCPFWDEFLNIVMDGDREMIDLLQRLAGYSLTCDISERKIFVAYGEGANGKTTFLETLAILAGDYACKMPLDALLERPKGNIPSDIARLRGARYAYASESPGSGKFDESRVKELTGGDKITARFMHRDFFEFHPTHKLWLATNHRPTVSGDDTAIWDRMVVLPFEVAIPPEKRLLKREVDARIRSELPGIFRWAIEGAYLWFEGGLAIPSKVTDAGHEYRTEMDHTGRFLEHKCFQIEGAKCGASFLYNTYKDYCKTVGEKPVSQQVFGMQVTKKGFKKKRSGAHGEYIYHDLGINLFAEVSAVVNTVN